MGGGMGFYYNTGTPAAPNWPRLSTGAAAAGRNWRLTGNSITDSPLRA